VSLACITSFLCCCSKSDTNDRWCYLLTCDLYIHVNVHACRCIFLICVWAQARWFFGVVGGRVLYPVDYKSKLTHKCIYQVFKKECIVLLTILLFFSSTLVPLTILFFFKFRQLCSDDHIGANGVCKKVRIFTVDLKNDSPKMVRSHPDFSGAPVDHLIRERYCQINE
jgi:hypothetical protein